jgi:coiled-coil domain-containing protein 55
MRRNAKLVTIRSVFEFTPIYLDMIQPKYISGLLSSAKIRKMDHLRAEDKMIQLERELEGDEFEGKEAFVTQAYKDQMAEVRRAEEEEKRREGTPSSLFDSYHSRMHSFIELEKKKGGKTSGMAHFYRKLLEESEQKHEETVAAATGSQPKNTLIGPQGPTPNLTITKPPNFTPKSDLEMARSAREDGKEVELNDDNQIVDKRELLSAGLNLSAPNTRRLGIGISPRDSTTSGEPVQVHRAVGTAASRKEINERRAREIHQQMEQEKERLAKEKELADQNAIQRTVAKRNTQEDVQSARDRYLRRKKRKMEVDAQMVPPDP